MLLNAAEDGQLLLLCVSHKGSLLSVAMLGLVVIDSVKPSQNLAKIYQKVKYGVCYDVRDLVGLPKIGKIQQ